MRMERQPGQDVYYLPLPSGRHAKVRVLTNYSPPALEISELWGTNVGDLEALGHALLSLDRQLKYPSGIMNGGEACSET